jgi:hypothetical protein
MTCWLRAALKSLSPASSASAPVRSTASPPSASNRNWPRPRTAPARWTASSPTCTSAGTKESTTPACCTASCRLSAGAAGLAPATVGHCYRAVFKSVINTAVLDGLLEVSPCYRIEQPEPRPQRFDPLTAAQVTAIARRAPARYRALILVAAACGTRFGESAGQGRSHVRKAHTPAPCGLLFTTPTGKALNPANWRARVWRPLIHAIPQVPDTTTCHHLRHTYASLLGDAGWLPPRSPPGSDTPAPGNPKPTSTPIPTPTKAKPPATPSTRRSAAAPGTVPGRRSTPR